MSRSANHFFTGAGASGPANYIEDVFNHDISIVKYIKFSKNF